MLSPQSHLPALFDANPVLVPSVQLPLLWHDVTARLFPAQCGRKCRPHGTFAREARHPSNLLYHRMTEAALSTTER